MWPTYAVITPQGDDGYLQAAGVLLRAGYAVYFLNPVVDAQRRAYFQQRWVNFGFSLGQPLFEAEDLGLYDLQLAHE